MTPKQIYSDLAKIAGHRCYDGKRFVGSKRIGQDHLEIIQSRIMALMEKLNYMRARTEFDQDLRRFQLRRAEQREQAERARGPRPQDPRTTAEYVHSMEQIRMARGSQESNFFNEVSGLPGSTHANPMTGASLSSLVAPIFYDETRMPEPVIWEPIEEDHDE